MKDRTLYPYLLGRFDDASLMSPVFYNHVDTEMLKELIQGDALFKIAGIDKGVNYRNFEGKVINL
jgi:hypothetical protein